MKKPWKIDVHCHASLFSDLLPPRPGTEHNYCSGEELLTFFEKLEIEKGVLLPIVSPEGCISTLSNEESKLIADKHPDRFVWFCNVDPRSMDNSPESNLAHTLNYYQKLGARGVGEMTSNIYVDDPKMQNLWGYCQDNGLPLLFHMSPRLGFNYGMVDDLGLPRLEKMLKKFPKLKVIGHSQPFWAEMGQGLTEDGRNGYPKGKVTPGRLVTLMRECENLYCDVSAGSGANAFMRDPEHAVSFLNEFQNRILYGCDICAVDNTHPFPFRDFLDELKDTGAISEMVYNKVCRENAVKLLGL
ncbi:MAG: amidohydrolase family protein [Clostridia bacterium]|nr:amidohydrolase family protein [Clostridia bacterium]